MNFTFTAYLSFDDSVELGLASPCVLLCCQYDIISSIYLADFCATTFPPDGGTGVGLWNIPNNFNMYGHGQWGQMPEQRERMQDWIVQACDPEAIATNPRVYHYLPIYKADHHGPQRNYPYVESWRSPLGSFWGSG